MKKIATLAIAAALAATAAPAVALEVPTVDSYIAISPCFTDCLEAAFLDASDATELDLFNDSNVAGDPFDDSSAAAEYNATTGIAFFVTGGGDLYKFDAINETGLELIADDSSLPPTGDSIFGLAMDDSTDTLYAMYFDSDAELNYVVTVDQSTGAIGTPLAMPFGLTMAGAQDFAISGGKIYVLTGVEQIKIFNLSDGALTGSIAYPMSDHPNFFGYAIDVSAGGVLRVAARNGVTSLDEFFSYDQTTSTWSDAVIAGTQYDGVAWFAAGSEAAPANLAETGFDASGLALASIALLGAGAATVAVRRRARR